VVFYLWLKAIVLNAEQKQRLYNKQVRLLNTGPFSQKQRRQKEVANIILEAKNEIDKNISHDAYKLFGAAMYWAEGSKTRLLQLTNSDPTMILFWVKWINKIFKISPKNLKAKLNIYPQQNEQDLKKFWSDLTGIPLINFLKSYVKPLSSNYRKNNLYYGTIRVEVPKSTNLRYRIFGWTQVVLASLYPKIQKIERKWERLGTVVKPVNLV